MSPIPLTKPENISNLLNMDQEYAGACDRRQQRAAQRLERRTRAFPERSRSFLGRLRRPLR